MTDKDRPTGLDDLSQRLKKAQGEAAKKDASGLLSAGLPKSATGLAFRVGVELVAGVVVGGAIGYGLDRWLGTSPLFLIVMFFLGAGGGMMNVWRAAMGQGLAVGYAEPGGDDEDDRPEDRKREG
ncbi:MAG: AtpZ/AtpI family protein [Alphaproteobacteria bacterium]|nr:AtpZ/AtpI family protein [Alphaproteobacteria bacterium]